MVKIKLIPFVLLVCVACSDQRNLEVPKKSTISVRRFAPPPISGRFEAAIASENVNEFWEARKLIRNGTLDIEVNDVKEAINKIRKIAHLNSGLLTDSEIIRDDEGHHQANLTVRVPSENFDNSLNEFRGLGTVEKDRIFSKDVTKAYFDLETRLQVKRQTEKRLKDLLNSKTGDLGEVVQVERELERLLTEIEAILGEKRYFDKQISLSTIHLRIFEPESAIRPGMFSEISDALRTSLRILDESVALIIYIFVFILPWSILGISGWFLFIFIRERSKRKKKAG